MNPLEADIEQRFVAYAESNNCKALKLRIDGANGFPDRTVLTPYGAFFAEFKRKGGKLRPAQARMIDELREMRFSVTTPNKIGKAEHFLDLWLKQGGCDFSMDTYDIDPQDSICLWKHDSGGRGFETACGEIMKLGRGQKPIDLCYCPFCGRRLR